MKSKENEPLIVKIEENETDDEKSHDDQNSVKHLKTNNTDNFNVSQKNDRKVKKPDLSAKNEPYIIKIEENETNDINNGDMASMQTTINDPILDLRNIFNKVNLSINIETNCGFQNQLFLVKATVDTITGQRYLDNPNGGRIAFENTDYCRSLIRDNLISITTPERRFGGEGKNFNLTLAVNRDEASLYVPVLINPHGSLFTYGKETSYGHQNLRNNTSKLNTFYFEDIKGLGDSDFNDLICTFSVLD